MKELFVLLISAGLLSCASSDPKKGASADEVGTEVSLKSDREEIEKLRAEIPEEVRKSNDRLAEVLKRWKIIKTPPAQLREKFDDEIRKQRNEFEKMLKRKREDFNRLITDKRRKFQDKQKEERDDFYSSKPKSDKRSRFTQDQSTERDRFNADLRDERDSFEDEIKTHRKNFESDMANKRTEFKQEYPEYVKLFNEMKKEEDSKAKAGVAPAAAGASAADPSHHDVNKGGDGWPSSDPAELNQVPSPSKSGN